MPFLSIVVPTMRAGGMDVLFDSLRRQTFSDFELVLVDGLYERRKALLAERARDQFLALRHVGLSPNPFPSAAFCAYSNAGISVASGEVVLFLVDYSRLPPDLLERHARFHRADPTGKGGLMGPHRYVHLELDPAFPRYGRGDVDRYEADAASGALDAFMWSCGRAADRPGDPHDADGGAVVPHDADPKLRLPAGPIGPEFFHAKNESVRRARVVEVDGYDQDLDGAHLYQDSDFSDRLARAGVRWLLDPTAAVEIVNPRHAFPFARRSRPHEENKAIWERKRAAGYPAPARPRLVDMKGKELEAGAAAAPPQTVPVDASRLGSVKARRLRVAMIYGQFSSAIHGPFDIQGLYTRSGLTGSEGSFFNLARTLAERGHEVTVLCDVRGIDVHPSGFTAMPIQAIGALPQVQGVDAVVAWNEPDYLRCAPAGALRVCDQQLNDFGYCQDPQWRDLVDVWVSPSRNHAANVMGEVRARRPVEVIPNSVDLDLFAIAPGQPIPVRDRTRVVWCSSPDRGLHHLLSFWPDVRRRVPGATLRVFYRLAPWLDRARGNDDEVGRRARYIEEVLPRLAPLGVEVHDLVPNARMAHELQEAACLAYPCDPVRYTEGFGCSVLDAAAGGCVPVVSGADALPEVHGSAVIGVPGPPQAQRKVWVDSISAVLEGRAAHVAGQRMHDHAVAHDRRRIADRWEQLLDRGAR
jgi:glycosyltransferase involved in cell wall biosynthesis